MHSGQNIAKIFTCVRYLTGLEKLPVAVLWNVGRRSNKGPLCQFIGHSMLRFSTNSIFIENVQICTVYMSVHRSPTQRTTSRQECKEMVAQVKMQNSAKISSLYSCLELFKIMVTQKTGHMVNEVIGKFFVLLNGSCKPDTSLNQMIAYID